MYYASKGLPLLEISQKVQDFSRLDNSSRCSKVSNLVMEKFLSIRGRLIVANKLLTFDEISLSTKTE